MNRLTIKNPNGKQLILKNGKVINHFSNLTESWMICDKLGKLEDLEEQLGCPLEVAFQKCEEFEKENKYNFYCICKWYEDWVILEIDTSIIGEPECSVVCFLPDYQKTWWLKGEKTNE